MAEGCCASIIKILLFIFNFIFWIIGIAILAIGIWLRVDANISKVVAGEIDLGFFYTACYVLIVAGAFTMVVGFLGCWGAVKENRLFLLLFAILIGLLVILEFVAGILAVVYRNDLDKWVTDAVNKALDGEKVNDKNANFQQFVIDLQKQFTCCGLIQISDWGNPCNEGQCKTCPISAINQCETATCGRVYKPCVDKLNQFLADNIIIVGGVGLAFAFLQIVGIVFACILRRNLDESSSNVA
uniref:Tetraspanin n=1 Tax=Branchiostoma belcheri tsingtauense TaxID=155462 RepID=Q2TCS0_BRABE|nr:tetraspanin family protein [Branchiostoma belcheri tsingtauense]